MKPPANTFSVSVQDTDAGTMAKIAATVGFMLTQSTFASLREGKSRVHLFRSLGGSSIQLQDTYGHLRLTCSFADLPFSLPISHFPSFLGDRSHTPCFSLLSGLPVSVG